MGKTKAILVASKNGTELQELIQANFSSKSVAISLLNDLQLLQKRLVQQPYDVLIIDLSFYSVLSNSITFVKQVDATLPGIAVLLVVTPEKRIQAIEQLRQRQIDYLLTPVNATELTVKIERIFELQNLNQHLHTATSLDSEVDALLMLNRATQEIVPTLQLDEALEIVLAKARELTLADVSKIYLTDQQGNLSKDNSLTKTTPLSSNPSEEHLLFMMAQQSAFAQQIVSQEEIKEQPGLTHSLKTALLIPMVSREKLIGVLTLGSTQSSYFSANHIRWLSVFCDQAAIAIENARLFQDLSSAYIDLAQSREKILHSRNTLRVMFDGINDGLYILDNDLTINALNWIAAERHGCEPRDLVGKSYLSLEWTKVAPELLSQIKESFRTGRDTTWISPEHETEPYLKDREFRIYPIRNRLAQIEQVMVFAQDVSERRRWQASLFRSANLAAVGQLAGSVAHQINNPLTVTMTNSQLILLDTDPENETYELAAGVLKAGERIQNIVTNLLEFSNQEQYFFVQTNLIEAIDGALDLVIRSLKKARIEVVKDYQVQPVLSASVSHLKLVWVNLLLNARDATVDYVEQPQIKIATRSVSEREVAVTITDNGLGLTESDFEQLFRPFFTTKSVGKALGLGLYSARAIIERHRGQIRASSQPGFFTTFEVILPLDNPRDL